MRSYDEITSQVLEKAAVKTVKIKRMRYTCTLSVVCAACVIGGSALMKLEKPEIHPDNPSESQSDSFLSASDPSTDVTEESTEATTVTTETTTTAAETTAPATTFDESMTTSVSIPADVITIYVEPGSAPITTSIPGEAHTTATTTKHSATTHKSETTETTTTTTVTETVRSETEPVTETEPIQSTAPDTEPVTEATTEIVTEPETTEPETTAPSEAVDENWQLLYDMYLNGDLPFSVEVLENLKALEELQTDETETETAVSLFPEFTE